ncbi:MAG: hypothetical protein ACXVBF_02650 [Flavisolibacter sp.]
MRTLSFFFAIVMVACNSPEVKKINVVGQAKIKIVPDMAELSLRSDNIRPTMKDAVVETRGPSMK